MPIIAFQKGYLVAVILAIWPSSNFAVGAATRRSASRPAITAAKVYFIAYYFMHIYRCWREEAH
jgi:hypothetical protein